ncbi:MAG: ubiquinone/menaquinone biosynthesis methyltransferase [Thermoguttaceae bacterium]|nr:ubiquinone/menaquinone biosynthesis methyltransferase [Thermoguttaceae bacterium]
MSDKTETKAASLGADKSPERVRTMFDQIAPKYDLLNDLLSLRLARLWRRKFAAKILSLLPEERAKSGSAEFLDAATGTGDLLVELRRQWRKRAKRGLVAGEFSGTGIDFSPRMLELAEKKFARAKISGLELLEADGTALPFPDARFDAISISFGLRNMLDPARGIMEMARVCRPGGVVAILEFTRTRAPIFGSLFRFYFRNVLPAIGQALAKNDKDAYRYLPQSVEEFDAPERILDHMRAAGLDRVEKRSMNFGVLASYCGIKK